MESKRIIFVGGESKGVDKLKSHLKSKYKVWNYSVDYPIESFVQNAGIGKANGEFYQAVQDLLTMANTSFNFETIATGDEVKKFLKGNADVLIVHRSSDELRASMAHVQDNLGVDVHRIFFGYSDFPPEEFDFCVSPDDETRIDKILAWEERISQ